VSEPPQPVTAVLTRVIAAANDSSERVGWGMARVLQGRATATGARAVRVGNAARGRAYTRARSVTRDSRRRALSGPRRIAPRHEWIPGHADAPWRCSSRSPARAHPLLCRRGSRRGRRGRRVDPDDAPCSPPRARDPGDVRVRGGPDRGRRALGRHGHGPRLDRDARGRAGRAVQPGAHGQQVYRYAVRGDGVSLTATTDLPGGTDLLDTTVWLLDGVCSETARVLACNDDDPTADGAQSGTRRCTRARSRTGPRSRSSWPRTRGPTAARPSGASSTWP